MAVQRLQDEEVLVAGAGPPNTGDSGRPNTKRDRRRKEDEECGEIRSGGLSNSVL